MSRFCKYAKTSDQAVKDDRFYEHLCKQLGLSIAENIFELCGMGEKIVSIDKPKTVEIYEPYTVEVRMYCNIDDFVRCKDCKLANWYKTPDGRSFCYCVEHVRGGYTGDDFCSRGERKKEDDP